LSIKLTVLYPISATENVYYIGEVESMRGAIALYYYFIDCGLKAHEKFINSPVERRKCSGYFTLLVQQFAL